MDKASIYNQKTQDLALLYELSLAVSNSMDLEENCQHFLDIFTKRLKANSASVWIKSAYLAQKAKKPSDYYLVFESPEGHIKNKSIERNHLFEEPDLSFYDSEHPNFKLLVNEIQIKEGAFAIFPLKEIGFLKLYANQISDKFNPINLEQFNQIIFRFAVSLENSLRNQASLAIIKASEKEKAENLLLNKQNQLKFFVEAAPAAIAMFDRHMNYLIASQMWFETNHLTQTMVEGKNYYEIFPEASENWRAIHYRCLQGNTERNEEEKIILPDGVEIWLKWEVRPWYNLKNQVEGLIILTEDISQRKKEKEELLEAITKAEEASQAKEKFLANMSHEIRTPMNAIMGMARFLGKTSLTTKQAFYQDAITTSAKNLLVIINDILDISKIEAGKLTIESVGFDLSRLVHHLVNANRWRAEEKGIGLFYEVDKKIAPVLLGDPVRLEQVFTNLINNAIKFTNEGRVEIECILYPSRNGYNKIGFSIIDTGKGIEEDKLNKIFESFTQEDESITREYGGTGLGLSISKHLVEIFGGELKVKSKKATGTTFYFNLEFEIGKPTDLIKEKETQRKEVDLNGVRILLAEDHDMNQYIATSILDEWGATVEVASNGMEAVEKLRLNPQNYDVILMDIQMPVMDGVEATKKIRKELKLDIPIIALTAHAIKGYKDKYMDVGMDDYVSKPFDPIELFNTVANLVGKKKQKKSVKKVVNHLDTEEDFMMHDHPAEGVNPIYTRGSTNNLLYDLTKLRSMVEGDEVMVLKMLRMFLEKTPLLIDEMKKFYEESSFNEVSKLAHKLKTSIILMGIVRLQNNVKLIEKYATEPAHFEELPALLEELENICGLVFEQMQEEFLLNK